MCLIDCSQFKMFFILFDARLFLTKYLFNQCDSIIANIIFVFNYLKLNYILNLFQSLNKIVGWQVFFEAYISQKIFGRFEN